VQYLFDFHEISRCTPPQGAAGAANIYILFRKNKKESAKKMQVGEKESRAKMPPLPPPRLRLAHRRFNPIKTIHFIWDGMKNPGGSNYGGRCSCRGGKSARSTGNTLRPKLPVKLLPSTKIKKALRFVKALGIRNSYQSIAPRITSTFTCSCIHSSAVNSFRHKPI